MRKSILWLVVIGLVLFSSMAFAGVETIKDNNDGNKGYILINTGEQQGGNDVGHWTDISDVPELKGDKGDKGDTGATVIERTLDSKGKVKSIQITENGLTINRPF